MVPIKGTKEVLCTKKLQQRKPLEERDPYTMDKRLKGFRGFLGALALGKSQKAEESKTTTWVVDTGN